MYFVSEDITDKSLILFPLPIFIIIDTKLDKETKEIQL